MQQTNEEIERIIKGPHKYEEGKGYYSVGLEALGYPAWRYHSEHPPRIVKDAQEDFALGPGWRHTPRPLPPPEEELTFSETLKAVPPVPSPPTPAIEEFIGAEPKRKPGRPKKDK